MRLIAVGDLMLASSVTQVILAHGPAYPFRPYRGLLGGADLAFGNLETCLSEGGEPTPGKSRESLADKTNFIFRAAPRCAQGLSEAGFTAVSVANNHSMDYGPDALRDTLAACRAAKVRPVGAGENLHEAALPAFFQRHGQVFALFAISDILPLYSAATPTRPGIAPARGTDFERRMRSAIRTARKKADWVLVSVHWGKEKFTGATPRQRKLGHQLVDWGADVVIGSHTHCLGPVEHYRHGLIHYSLGNFIASVYSRADVGAWEVTFRRGKAPVETSLRFRWNGKPYDTASAGRLHASAAPVPETSPAVPPSIR